MSERSEPAAEFPFVGRQRELEQLRALVERDTRTSCAIEIAGPAGIGKTRLVREFARSLSPARVAWESCRRTAAYGPWSRIAGRLADRPFSGLAAIVLGDDTFAASRADLFEATVEFFREHASAEPLLIVLDDLHDADSDTLALTRHASSMLGASKVTILSTVRADPREAALIPGAARLVLAGLDTNDVQSLLGHDHVAERFRSRTAGNPLHLERLVRRASGEPSDAPLAELITRQVDELGDDERATLFALTVLDRPTIHAELSAVSGVSEPSSYRSVEALRTAGFIDGEGTVEQPLVLHHGLIGAVALQQVDRDALRLIHGRAADVIASEPGSLDLVSQHLLVTHAANSEDRVREYLASGLRAANALAYGEAAQRLSDAATALQHLDSPAVDLVVDVHIALASALARLRDSPGAEAARDAAWSAATRSDDAAVVARGALGADFRFGFAGERGVECARRCEIALAGGSELPESTRARLHAALACHALGYLPASEARSHAERAVSLAERAGDDYALGCALIAWVVTDLDPDSLDERLLAAHRIAAIAETCGAVDLASNAYFLLMACLLERGDVRLVDAELASRHRRSSSYAELENGRHAGWFRCMRAILDGRIGDAETLSLVALQAAREEGDEDALPVHIGQLGIIRWLQGREAEVEPFYAAARVEQPNDAVWVAVLARLWALSGRHDAARGALDALGDLSSVARDRNWLITMATAAEAAAETHHEATLPALREMLIPYSARLVPIGLGIACWGTVARPLALVCRALGRTSEAEHFLRSAIQSCSAAGAQPWIAQAQVDLAELLIESDPSSDEALRLAQSALATAQSLSIVPVLESAEAILASRETPLITSVAPQAHSPNSPTISVLGTFAVTGANGETASWTSRKARELLKLVVARQGRALLRDEAIDALWPGSHSADAANRLSVALSTVRRALDPAREHPPDAFIIADRAGISLRSEAVTVDLTAFRDRARRWNSTDTLNRESEANVVELRSLLESYAGDAFADEPYADWASGVRDSTRSLFVAAAHEFVALCESNDDDLGVVEMCNRILEADPFDEPAHQAMIAALERLGAHGRATHARSVYRARLMELGIESPDVIDEPARIRRSAS